MKIEVYGYDQCPFCLRAKQLLQEKGWDYIYYNIKTNPEYSNDLQKRLKNFGVNGSRITVPQIFINDDLIGGYTDLNSYVLQIDSGRT